tara:strand:+ start:226 stop:999 length:774 start_codon:yes stop_codon:yes gene_type:complete
MPQFIRIPIPVKVFAGTADATSSDTQLVDAAANFDLGYVRVGDLVYDTTTLTQKAKPVGVISSIDNATTLTMTTLGSFASASTYDIYAPQVSTGRNAFSSQGIGTTTSDGTSTNEVIDTGFKFSTYVVPGDVVYNLTDGTTTTIRAGISADAALVYAGLDASKSFFVGHPVVTPKYIYMNSSVVVDVNSTNGAQVSFLNDASSSSDNLTLTGLNLGENILGIIDEAQEMISKANSSVTGNFYDYDFRFFAPLFTTTS